MERLTMRKAREILRQKWVLDRSHREVALSLGVCAGVVSSTVVRARKSGLEWEQVAELGEEEIEKRLGVPTAQCRIRDAPHMGS
jgi:hypothetical protein